MENSFKNKNLLVIIFEILIIVLGVGGITFATTKLINNSTTTLIETGKYNIDYVGDKEVMISDIEPMSDDLVNYNTSDNVIRIEFSLRSVASNKEDDLIYDIMLNEMEIDCSLLNKYTKWNLYKNGNLLSRGSLDPTFDGNVLTDSMRLTNIQEDLPSHNADYDKYVLIFWISESCDNLETCELIDQSNIANSKMNMNVFIALYSGAKKEFKRTPNYDGTCANKPDMYDNMVAVTYKNGQWVVADTTNSDKSNLWYSYSEGKWANAVVVNGSNNKYRQVGTKIESDDILAQYVWIPRYRYKLWNATDEVMDNYNAYDNGIDIIFENGLGNIKQDNYENGLYLTHPVFGNNLRGFWISKYEMSKNGDIYKFVPNVDSYRNDTIENYQNITSSLVNDYKLGKKAESHMINNLEWGATLYLSHSKYGVCSVDGCDSIGLNNSYTSGANKQDTTTRNVYGVYDMAGGSGEYVLGNYKIGSATNEVILSDGDTWYQGHGLISERDYIIRGGLERGMFYFGDISMSPVENGTRNVLISKTIEE